MRKKMDYPKGILGIWDCGADKCADHFTVIYDDPYDPNYGDPRLRWCLAMSAEPFYPQGFCQHCSAIPGRHLGKRITFESLPDDCKKAIRQDMAPDVI